MTTFGNTTVVNTTPHTINIIGLDGVTRSIPASGKVIRVNTASGGQAATLGDTQIPLFEADLTDGVTITDGENTVDFNTLPQNEETMYIVSGMVGAKLKHRHDIFVPMTSPSDNPLRNEKGHISAVRGLKRP